MDDLDLEFMDPTAVREASATTLRRLERNDPSLRFLRVYMKGDRCTRVPLWMGVGLYRPSDGAGLTRLGNAIGSSRHVNHLDFKDDGIEGIERFDDRDCEAFFRGLERNTSITTLVLGLSNLSSRGFGSDILSKFVMGNVNLRRLELSDCSLGDNVGRVLSACTTLEYVKVLGPVDDDAVEDIVSGVRGLAFLSTLELSHIALDNGFGSKGCGSLAALLQDADCNLRVLKLCSDIDDNCAGVLANSLKGNKKLQELGFLEEPPATITESGWKAFTNVLSNPSSNHNTEHSNHTLMSLGRAVHVPNCLSYLLMLNADTNKERVALKKTLLHHPHLFIEWDLKVMPFAITWFARTTCSMQNDEENARAGNLSAIYKFTKALPTLFVKAPPSILLQGPQSASAGKRERYSGGDQDLNGPPLARTWFYDRTSGSSQNDEVDVGLGKVSSIFKFFKTLRSLFSRNPKRKRTWRRQ